MKIDKVKNSKNRIFFKTANYIPAKSHNTLKDIFIKSKTYSDYNLNISPVISNSTDKKNPINLSNLFKIFLKSINKNYSLPFDLQEFLPNTLSIINKIGFINYNQDYYSVLYTPIANYLVKNSSYLLRAGIIFFLLSNSKADSKLTEELKQLMKDNNDSLLQDISFFLDNQTHLNKKIFDFLASAFILNSPLYTTEIPNQIFELFLKSKQILNVLNFKNYIDLYLWSEINTFLKSFFPSLNLHNYFRNLTHTDVETWKKFFTLMIQIATTLNNIKPYQITGQNLENVMHTLHLMNLTLKNNSYFLKLQNQMYPKEHKDILNRAVESYQSNGIQYNEAIKNTISDFYSSYVMYVFSFIRKSMREKDFSYGDFYHFFKIYTYSSILLEFIKNTKDNSPTFNSLKNNLASILLEKKFANSYSQFLNNPDKQQLISALEILRTISQRVTISSFALDPNLPKNRQLYLRLNLWIKNLKNLPKDNKYKENLTKMIHYLHEILRDYPNTEKLSLILNEINFETIPETINILDTILNSLAGSNISKKYENIDYLFSQAVITSYLKNNQSNNYINNEFRQKLIENIYKYDNELVILLEDLNFYNTLNNSQTNFRNLLEVLDFYYKSCIFLI